MKEVIEFIKENYVKVYPNECKEFTDEFIYNTIVFCRNIYIERHEGNIVGVALFFKLTDETERELTAESFKDVEMIKKMASEDGDNIHVWLCCAKGLKMIRKAIKELGGRTISWFEPDMKILHKYKRGA